MVDLYNRITIEKGDLNAILGLQPKEDKEKTVEFR